MCDGELSVDGTGSYTGGSGGSLLIKTSRLRGHGNVQANGGSASSTCKRLLKPLLMFSCTLRIFFFCALEEKKTVSFLWVV